MAGFVHQSLKESAKRSVFAMAVAGSLIAATTVTAVAEPLCWTSDDRSALRSRVLQTDLMVAALNCGMQSDYNQFVRHFSAPLVLEGRALKSLFRDSLGRGYKQSLDRFVTKLANESSMRSLRNPDGFCADAEHVISTSQSLHPDDYTLLVQGYGHGHLHGVPACRMKGASVKQSAKAG